MTVSCPPVSRSRVGVVSPLSSRPRPQPLAGSAGAPAPPTGQLPHARRQKRGPRSPKHAVPSQQHRSAATKATCTPLGCCRVPRSPAARGGGGPSRRLRSGRGGPRRTKGSRRTAARRRQTCTSTRRKGREAALRPSGRSQTLQASYGLSPDALLRPPLPRRPAEGQSGCGRGRLTQAATSWPAFRSCSQIQWTTGLSSPTRSRPDSRPRSR
jgi:hypothetical protein